MSIELLKHDFFVYKTFWAFCCLSADVEDGVAVDTDTHTERESL